MKSIREKLSARKYKKPNPVFYGIYQFVNSTKLLGRKYNPSFEIIDSPKDCKGGCFVIWNHQSRRDHTIVSLACWPRRVNIVCEYNEFFRSHLHNVLCLNQILPKKPYAQDMAGTRAMFEIIKQGGCVAFSPEGNCSHIGDNQPIVPGTGRFLQAFHVPIYIANVSGFAMTTPNYDFEDRIGKTHVKLQLLFSKEDLAKMAPSDIENKINEEFRFDDFEYNKTARIPYKFKKGVAHNIKDLLYRCPKCGAEFTMESGADYIKCTKCGNEAKINEYYDLIPVNGDCVIPKTITDWCRSMRKTVIDEIREDANYSFEFKVKIGKLPDTKFVKNYGTSVECGEGMFVINHAGVHYVGTKDGEPWNFDFSYKDIFTISLNENMKKFSIYVDGDYYDFVPEYSCVSKTLFVIEEMHRLHVNTWKNFSWYDYMYEGKKLGIDVEEKR